MKQRYWIYLTATAVLIGSILISSCAQQTPAPSPAPVPSPASAAQPRAAWMAIELTDVITGQNFKINDFKGKTVLLESFAVWCPTCLRQQKELKKVAARGSDALIHISLDTAPNEDEAQVKAHAEKNGLDWYFVVAPIELTNALIDEFGLTVISAPFAPVILICEDQSARLLKNGVKSADTILSEVAKGCD